MRTLETKPQCSVIIPAYNEASVIGRTLSALLKGAEKGEFDVFVVCNGCTDDTAGIAQDAAPDATIISLANAGKTEAINAGIAATIVQPIVFLDADIITTAGAIRSLIHFLKVRNVDMAYGNAHFRTLQSSLAVRCFYKAWAQNPYFNKSKMGGFFAVSANGISKLGQLPSIINDDEYVRRSLTNSVFVQAARYTVEAPRTLWSLIKVRSRVYRGNAQLADQDLFPSLAKNRARPSQFVARLFVRPSLWLAACIYCAVTIMAHARNAFSFKLLGWDQDTSARKTIEADA